MLKNPLLIVTLPLLFSLCACEEASSSSTSIDLTLCSLHEATSMHKSFVEGTVSYTSIYQVDIQLDENGEKSHYSGWQHYTTTCMDYGDIQEYSFVKDNHLYYGHAEEGNSFYMRSRKESDDHYALYFSYLADFSEFTNEAICHADYNYEDKYSPEPYEALATLSISVVEGDKRLSIETNSKNKKLQAYSSTYSYIDSKTKQEKKVEAKLTFTYRGDGPSELPDMSEWEDLTPAS